MKKGQLMGLPFIMIFALVVGGLILFYGARVVLQLQGQAENVQLNKFVTDLRKDVQTYYFLDEGSSKRLKLSLPGEVEWICFRSSYRGDKTPNNLNELDANLDFFMKNVDENLLFVPLNSFDNTKFNVNNLGNDDLSTLCVENGKTVQLISKGTHVEVSP